MVVLIIFMASYSSILSVSTDCPRDWTKLGSRCYQVFTYSTDLVAKEDRTWHSANDRCIAHGGYLVCINDQAEDKIVSYIRKVGRRASCSVIDCCRRRV